MQKAYVVMHGHAVVFSDEYVNDPIAVFTAEELANNYIATNSVNLSKEEWYKEKLWIWELPLDP